MFYKCFKCLEVYSAEQLIAHITLFHRISENFVCVECSHTYQSLKSFKRHIKKCVTVDSSTYSNVFPETSSNYKTNNTKKNVETIDTVDNLQKALSHIKSAALLLISSLYEKSNFAISDAERIVNDLIVVFLNEIMSQMENFFSLNLTLKTDNVDQFLKLIDFCKNPFKEFNTFYKYLKVVKDQSCYSDPVTFDIHNEIAPVIVKQSISFGKKSCKGALMPLQFQFKKFFEMGNNLDLIIENTNRLEQENANTGIIKNIINGDTWRNKVLHKQNTMIFPFILYFDEFEINNSLGSHAGQQSLAAFYYNFPTLPQHFLSSLSTIFLALVFKSKDFLHGTEVCLNLLIEEIKLLEDNGILINHNGEEKRVHFILSAIIGDNLGLNSLLGFSKSFKSSFPCRICKFSQSDISSGCKESLLKFRTCTNYENDITAESNVTKRIKLSGLRESCVFNSIKSFHVTSNLVADIMHDLFEGVCHYDICQILLHLIENDKIVSLDILNSRKQSFNYGETETGNISPPIKLNHLKTYKLHMSASEMWTFCHFLPLIIGDIIPRDNQYWKLLCFLVEIVDIVLKTEFDDSTLLQLQQYIFKHHSLYITLFGDTLKPKHHFLLHYPTIIRNMGPLRFLWCFRFESKHRELKQYTNNTNSRKNIAYSIGVKYSLKFCSALLNKKALCNKDTFGSIKSGVDLGNLAYCKEINIIEIFGSSSKSTTDKVIYKNIVYKKGFFIFSKCLKLLYCIIDIIIDTTEISKSVFLCEQYDVSKKNFHFQSFEVLEKTNNYFIVPLENDIFFMSPLHTYLVPSNKTYIRPKYY